MKLEGDAFLRAAKTPKGVFWISGEEPLLQQELADQVRSSALSHGFTERIRLFADASFDWSQIVDHYQALSLFGDKKIIDIHLSVKLNDQAKAVLADIAAMQSDDTIMLLCSGKIETKQLKAKWCSRIIEQAHFTQVWSIKDSEYPLWLTRRIARHKLTIDDEALDRLTYQTEGNLLAAAQEIEKLTLYADNGHITLEHVEEAVGNNARFDLFELTERALNRDLEGVVRALHGLRSEGTDPSPILWAVSKEVRTLMAVFKLVREGQDSDKALMSLQIWRHRQRTVRQAVKRIHPKQMTHWLEQCERVDYYIKHSQSELAWQTLEEVLVTMTGTKLPHLDELL